VSGGHDDYAVEPIRGLPEQLPAGERIIWQGAPSWWELATSVFHIRAVALYFAALMLWRGSVHWTGSHHAVTATLAALSLLPVCAFGLGLLALLAWLSSRTSVYTVTNRRVVMRVGVALPTAINIPFKVIESAGVAINHAGAADIPLTLIGTARIPYSTLWPHARPWRLRAPEPMLRGIPDGIRVAGLLRNALHEASLPPPSNVIALRRDTGQPAKTYAPALDTAEQGQTVAG
jgi:hypothetical protein